jgi:nucleotide-binding universal stress UspA family protein
MRVLLPVDESDASELTLTWISGFLDRQSARLHLLHVVDSRMASAERALDKGHVEVFLDKVSRMMEEAGYTVEKASHLVGLPAEKILEYADRHGILMIIMGANGRKGLGKLLMGSVSEEVFRMAKQQVLVLNNTHRPSLTIPIELPR